MARRRSRGGPTEKSFEFVLGDDDEQEYEVVCVGFEPYSPGDRDSPPGGGEVEISDTVTYTVDGDATKHTITLDEFYTRYAEAFGMDAKWARETVEYKVFEDMIEELRAEYESQEDSGWDDR